MLAGKLTVEGIDDKPALIELDFLPQSLVSECNSMDVGRLARAVPASNSEALDQAAARRSTCQFQGSRSSIRLAG